MKTRKFRWIVRGFALAMAAFGAMFATTTARAAVATDKFVLVKVKVADGQKTYGKVSGGKMVKAGTVLTLTATPNKGYGFAGWYKDKELTPVASENQPVAYTTSWKYTVQATEDQTFVAKFVPAEEDSLELVDQTQGDGYSFGLNVTPQVMVGLGAAIGECSVPTTIKVSKLPSGISYVKPGPYDFFGKFEGKAKQSGVYYVEFAAENKNGYKHFLTQKWIVGGAYDDQGEFDEIGIDWDDYWMRQLTDMRTGKLCFAYPRYVLESKGVVKLQMSPLPAGVKMDAVDWSIEGYPTKPGLVSIAIKATMNDGSVKKALKRVIVKDSGYRYVSITPTEACKSFGTATKSGVYQVGAKIPLTAKPLQKNVYFAGWYFEDNDVSDTDPTDFLSSISEYTDSGEYRNASDKFLFEWDLARGQKVTTIYAKFIPREADFMEFYTDTSDGCIVLTAEHTFFEDSSEDFEYLKYYVTSWTLPTVTAKNLPPGMTLDAKQRCIVADRSKVVPGVYRNASITAKNLTGIKQTILLTLRVANIRSDIFPNGNYGIGEDGYNLMVGQDVESSDLSLWLDNSLDGPGWWKSSVSGLPPGMSHAGIELDDSGSERVKLTGAPTKAGLYTLTVTLTHGTGQDKETKTFTVSINVRAIPSGMTGVFNGLTSFSPNGTDPYDDVRPESREVTITSKENGTLSAKVGKQVFSKNLGHGWQVGECGECSYDLYTAATKENGLSIVYHMHIDAAEGAKAFGEYGFTGNIEKITLDAAGKQTATSVKDGSFYTYQNVLTTDGTLAPLVSNMAKQTSKGIGFEVVEDKDFVPDSKGREKYNLKYTLDSKKALVKVKVSTKGVATIAGKVGGQAINCTTTLYPVYDEDENSMTFCGRVPTTINERPALVWINLGFWLNCDGKPELSEFMGTIYLR